MVGGAFFQTRVRTPRMSRSSISNGEPGRVSSALASASERAGNFLLKRYAFPSGIDLRARIRRRARDDLVGSGFVIASASEAIQRLARETGLLRRFRSSQ